MYNAIICRIKTFPHPDADKIQLGNAHGFQVVVGLDTIENDQDFTFLKHKSHTFGVLEGYIKEKDDYVDMEEVS